jgi:hypothetical protein
MLFDVILHEIGHHRTQQYRRRTLTRALRTRDHEITAAQFARQYRLKLGQFR